jgi:hypothetical protein
MQHIKFKSSKVNVTEIEFEREREREPRESGMIGEKARTRRVARADGFFTSASLRRWQFSGVGGSSVVELLSHACSEI